MKNTVHFVIVSNNKVDDSIIRFILQIEWALGNIYKYKTCLYIPGTYFVFVDNLENGNGPVWWTCQCQ